MLRRIGLWVLAGTVVGALFAGPVAARPATQSTTCTAQLLLNISPGLTFTAQAQQLSGKGRLSGCTGGGVTSATGKGSGSSASMSCTSGTASGTLSLTWDTAERSRISWTVDVSSGSFTGTVTQGKFAGEPVSGSLTLTPLQGNCFTPVTKARAVGSVSL